MQGTLGEKGSEGTAGNDGARVSPIFPQKQKGNKTNCRFKACYSLLEKNCGSADSALISSYVQLVLRTQGSPGPVGPPGSAGPSGEKVECLFFF